MLNISRRARVAAYRLPLLASAASMASVLALALPVSAHAQSYPTEQKPRSYDIPAQSLPDALHQFMQQSSIQVGYPSDIGENVTAAPVKGTYSPAQALSRLLAGTGLTYRQTGNRTFTLERAPKTSSGAIQLGTLRVEGASDNGGAQSNAVANGGDTYLTSAVGDGRSDAELKADTYRGVGGSAYISQADIQRNRGSSVGDFLSGIPGVMNAENRSGALDVNIRGMQGQGRVPIVIDGAMQETTVYRGYSGVAGRSYMDPDLIGGISVEKGASSGADATGAIGGILRARTLNAGDIVAPGGTWGVIVRGGLTSNNRTPPAAATIGGDEPAVRNFDRPGALDPRGWNGSVALAYREDKIDLVAAYARRKNGNYYAGERGGDHEKWGDGQIAFKYGEQILNTSQDNESYLLRAVLRPSSAHTLDLSYMRYNSVFGEMKPSQLMYGPDPYQTATKIGIDTITGRYRFKPDGTLVDLKVDAWATRTNSIVVDPIRFYGYNMDQFGATLANRLGITVSNTSRLSGGLGDLTLAYGGAFDYEKIGKSDAWDGLNAKYPGRAWDVRHGWRRQFSFFANGEYKPAHWATFNASVRYINNTVQDLNKGNSLMDGGLLNREHATGWSPIFSALVEPIAGLQFYSRYSRALRAPTLFESTEGLAGGTNPYSTLKPEQARNTEFGVNYQKVGIFSPSDLVQAKLTRFDNDVRNFISLGQQTVLIGGTEPVEFMVLVNVPRVRMQGVEFSARYDAGMAFLELGGTNYTSYKSEGMLSTGLEWLAAHTPPKDSYYATAGARLFDERLMLNARFTYIKNRPNYELLDLFAGYDINDRANISFSVNNLFDRFYVDALSLGTGSALLPSPGRTVKINVTGRLGNGKRTHEMTTDLHDRMAALTDATLFSTQFDGDWSGLYVGGGWGKSFISVRGNTNAKKPVTSAVAQSERTSVKANSINPALHIGYNFQTPSGILAGIELEGDLTRAKASQSFISSELDLTQYSANDLIQAKYDHAFRHSAMARLRLGQSFGRFMLFASGGVAVIDERQTRTQYRANYASSDKPFGYYTRPYFVENASKTRLGYTIGGGAEYAFNNRISLRGEYLFSKFPEQDFVFPRASRNIDRGYTDGSHVVAGGADDPIGRLAASSLEMQTVRLGLNYRF